MLISIIIIKQACGSSAPGKTNNKQLKFNVTFFNNTSYLDNNLIL